MTEGSRVPLLLRLAMGAAVAGALTSLALFLKPGPYTLVAFMFVAQPLLALAFILFTLQVFRDLRKGKVL